MRLLHLLTRFSFLLFLLLFLKFIWWNKSASSTQASAELKTQITNFTNEYLFFAWNPAT